MPLSGEWTCCCGDRNIGFTHCSGIHPLPTGGGSLCTEGRDRFPHRYKPSSRLRPYIADTSALPMKSLVTTMVGTALVVSAQRGKLFNFASSLPNITPLLAGPHTLNIMTVISISWAMKMKMKRPILNLHNASIHLWREGVAPWMQSGNDETRSWRFQLFQKFFQLFQKYFQLFQIFFHFSRNIFPLRRSMSSLEGGPSIG